MTTALATNDEILVSMGILPKPRPMGDTSAGRIKFQRGHFILVDYDRDAGSNKETDLGTTMRAVILPQTAYQDGRRLNLLATEFYQAFRSDQKAVCRSYVTILKEGDDRSESERLKGYAGVDRSITNDCEQCYLGEYQESGRWRRIKDSTRLPKDEQPCKYRGELLVIPEGHEGVRRLGLAYTSLQQVKGSFRDPREGTVPNVPTLAAHLAATVEFAQAFVSGQLVCEFSSVLAKSDNKVIGSYEVMTVKPVGVLPASVLVATPTAPAEAAEPGDDDGPAPWDLD